MRTTAMRTAKRCVLALALPFFLGSGALAARSPEIALAEARLSARQASGFNAALHPAYLLLTGSGLLLLGGVLRRRREHQKLG